MDQLWQHVAVTLVAAAALVVLVRPWLPAAIAGRRQRGPAGACGSCATGAAACSTAATPGSSAAGPTKPAGGEPPRPLHVIRPPKP